MDNNLKVLFLFIAIFQAFAVKVKLGKLADAQDDVVGDSFDCVSSSTNIPVDSFRSLKLPGTKVKSIRLKRKMVTF